MHIQTYRSETVTLLFEAPPGCLQSHWLYLVPDSFTWATKKQEDLGILPAMSQARKRMEKPHSVQTVAPFPNTLPTVRAVNHYLTGWCCLISHVQGMAGIKKEQPKVLENIPTGNN